MLINKNTDAAKGAKAMRIYLSSLKKFSSIGITLISMKAIQAAAVYNADSYAMTRPGPRLAEAAIGLYEFLYGTEIDETAIQPATVTE